MSRKMLIDASQPEETRVAIVNGSRLEELDYESQNNRQLRGNVYLARVTRVEPSLQAAFVEYGGNRHGFLAFSEIHPDYYQIPYEDRMALLEAEEAENLADMEAEEKNERDDDTQLSSDDETESHRIEATEEPEETESSNDHADKNMADHNDADDEDVSSEQEKTASVRRRRISRHRYKIQEVIKRGQILLIQVVKEERGNKGAAMTTYLSLAGRYCVLMPNTPRGGGISRKIANGSDRKRLKTIVSDFDVPQGMGVIIRTAGAKRTKLEIKRDYDYLCRLWETIRTTTLKSIAPALIHEEGNLVKRSIRDLYNKDIEVVLVQGDNAYKTAKSFIKMLMPSHAKNVKAYKDPIPLFVRYRTENAIEDCLNSVVELKSGGYLVIHPTEALVSVDVNSGRSTRERNVERTALKTNLEAADEVARQMRLRDLAGLIVIDFIDMDENRNNRAVEKRMREALSQDRARLQMGRISQFGLMEISRQRRRRSLLEGSSIHCEHCQGVGRRRSVESSALKVIRQLEEMGVRNQTQRARLTVAPEVALYIFNEKRHLLLSMDEKFDMFTELLSDKSLISPDFKLEAIEARDETQEDPLLEIEKELKKQNPNNQKSKKKKPKKAKSSSDSDVDLDQDHPADEDDKDQGPRRRKRRRGRRGGRQQASNSSSDTLSQNEEHSQDAVDEPSSQTDIEIEAQPATTTKPRKSKTQSKASSKSQSKTSTRKTKPATSKSATKQDKADKDEAPETDEQEAKADQDAPKTKARPKRSRKKSSPTDQTSEETTEGVTEKVSKKTPPKTRRTRKTATPKKDTASTDDTSKSETFSDPSASDQKTPRKATSTTRRKAPTRKTVKEDKDTDDTALKSAKEPKSSTKSSASNRKKPTAQSKPSKDTDTKDGSSSDKKKSGKRGWWLRRKRS